MVEKLQLPLKIIHAFKALKNPINIKPYQEQDKDNFIKERKKAQVGLYTKGAKKTQEVVLSEQFREFYYNCVVNQKVVFNYVHYTGKTEAELLAILFRILVTKTLISTDPYLIMYFPFSSCYARQVMLNDHTWFGFLFLYGSTHLSS